MSVVLPACSVKVKVDNISSGHIRLIGCRVASPCSSKGVDEDNFLGRTDFAMNEFAPQSCPSEGACGRDGSPTGENPVGGMHGESFRSPPIFHVLRIGERLPNQFAWRVENARNGSSELPRRRFPFSFPHIARSTFIRLVQPIRKFPIARSRFLLRLRRFPDPYESILILSFSRQWIVRTLHWNCRGIPCISSRRRFFLPGTTSVTFQKWIKSLAL